MVSPARRRGGEMEGGQGKSGTAPSVLRRPWAASRDHCTLRGRTLMIRRAGSERAIVEASSAADARIHAPAEQSHEMIHDAAPLNTQDVLGEAPGTDVVVARAHLAISPLKST